MFWIRDADKKAISVEHIVSFEVIEVQFKDAQVKFNFGCNMITGAWHVLERGFLTEEEALKAMEVRVWTIQHSVFAAKMSDEEQAKK